MAPLGLFCLSVHQPDSIREQEPNPAAWKKRVHGKALARCNSVRTRGAGRICKPRGSERIMQMPFGAVTPIPSHAFAWGRGVFR